MTSQPEQFPVFEWTGTGRSGKGTVVGHLAKTHNAVITDEAGADFRVLTRCLLDDGRLRTEMSLEGVQTVLSITDYDAMTEIIANSKAVIAQKGKTSLYAEEVNEIVGKVGTVENVQHAVREGFRRRIEKVVRSGDYAALLLDHRYGNELVASIPEARSVLRNFVTCSPLEAAWRECVRQDIPPGGEEFMTVFKSIEERNEMDATRPLFPVAMEAEVIDYWNDPESFQATVQRIADDQFGGDFAKAVLETFNSRRDWTDVIRHGIGTAAVRTGRQVHFDTTAFRSYEEPKAAMLDAAEIMFQEALAEAHITILDGQVAREEIQNQVSFTETCSQQIFFE